MEKRMIQMALTVAGGLVELKLLDKRILKATQGTFVSYRSGKDLPKGFKDIEEITDTIKANFDSVSALIERRNTIKSAIVVSNAVTKVEIAGETMTVAEAIERKNSIAYEKQLLNAYKFQLGNAIRTVDHLNEEVKKRADNMVEAFLGGDKSKASEAEKLRNDYLESHSAAIIDTIDIKKQIEKLEERIDKFEADVDLVLSTSNAITELNIA